jgi:hypothetical protein
MQDAYQYRNAIEPNPRLNVTNVSLKISVPAVFESLEEFDWEGYVEACRRSLYRVAARESMEVLLWSTDLDFDEQLVCHHVCVRGVLRGTLPLLIVRALRPPPGYWNLDFLARGVGLAWRMERILKAQVEAQHLKRYDRAGKRLEDPIPSQLLARALVETNWRLLISPSDAPWAYINQATQRVYERQYEETAESENQGREVGPQRSNGPCETGDALQLEVTPDLWRAAGITEEVVAVLEARAAGKQWHELPEYLTALTGTSFDSRRIEAARGKLRRRQDKLRIVGLAASHWGPRPGWETVYLERLPHGEPWSGHRTYAHKYQGEELEVMGDLMRQERSKLFRKN